MRFGNYRGYEAAGLWETTYCSGAFETEPSANGAACNSIVGLGEIVDHVGDVMLLEDDRPGIRELMQRSAEVR
jgi:hypothetical protein